MRIGAWAVAGALALGPGAAKADEEEGSRAPKERKTSLAVVPGPFYNPSQGLGLMVLPMLMFYPSAEDQVSPPSTAVLIGMFSVLPPLDEADTRYSWTAGSATRLYLDEDRWRIQAAVAYFNLFREFHGVGGDPSSSALFGYRQYGGVVFAQVLREVGVSHLYAGLMGGYTTFRSTTSDPANQQILESLGAGADWKGQPILGFVSQYDSRDSQYYPSAGADFNLRVNGSLKSGDEYLVVVPTFAQYFSLSGGNKLVLAYKIFGQFGFGDDLPFASYAYYGSRGTTLGYSTGEYVDKMMLGAEAEIRWLFWKRLGAEGGLGLGKVFPSFDQFGPQPWLPGIWGSFTYKVMAEQDMRARLTLAAGKTGGALYFAVGQNF
ncbi:MAG TPA: hypothetical protein VMK66_13885 [Myxococcales bacterium]|nr:hypothetical protein [Myxococcales bacterium]